MSVALAASAGLGILLGSVSLALSPGPSYPYFAIWLAYVPLSLLVAVGVALLAPADSHLQAGRFAEATGVNAVGLDTSAELRVALTLLPDRAYSTTPPTAEAGSVNTLPTTLAAPVRAPREDAAPGATAEITAAEMTIAKNIVGNDP